MILHVGTIGYSVVLSDQAIFDSDGNQLEGCALEARKLIVLSRIVEPDRREEIAEHEFYHCWLFHVPKPANEEEAAQFHALVAKQFRRDLKDAGGPDAFLSLRPTRVSIGRPSVSRADHLPGFARQSLGAGDRIPCGGCDADVMAGSIHTGPAIAQEGTGRFYVERWMRCDACGAVQAWNELATAEGTPLGEFCAVPRPRVMRGVEAGAWMVEHGEAIA